MHALLHDSRTLDALALHTVGVAAQPSSGHGEWQRISQVQAEHAQQRAAAAALALQPTAALAHQFGDQLSTRAAAALAHQPPTSGPAAAAAAAASAEEAAAWRGRMVALHAETQAMHALRGLGRASHPAFLLAAARGSTVAPRAFSTRHVATAHGLRTGRLAPGACPLPPQESCGSPVEDAIAGRMYWRYLEFTSGALLHDRAF